MKFLILLILGFSVIAFASEEKKNLHEDQDFSCIITSEHKKYDDILIIEVREKGLSKVKYKRRYSCSPKDGYGELMTLRGCYHARQYPRKNILNHIDVRCLSDGEEGWVTINPKTLKGDFYFYYPKMGYGERELFDIQCEKFKMETKK